MFFSFFAAHRARHARAAALVVMTFGLTGCSSLPDYANPVSWYERAADKVGGWFSDDGVDQTSDAGGFPALKKAPPPRAVTSGAERDSQSGMSVVTISSTSSLTRSNVLPACAARLLAETCSRV